MLVFVRDEAIEHALPLFHFQLLMKGGRKGRGSDRVGSRVLPFGSNGDIGRSRRLRRCFDCNHSTAIVSSRRGGGRIYLFYDNNAPRRFRLHFSENGCRGSLCCHLGNGCHALGCRKRHCIMMVMEVFMRLQMRMMVLVVEMRLRGSHRDTRRRSRRDVVPNDVLGGSVVRVMIIVDGLLRTVGRRGERGQVALL